MVEHDMTASMTAYICGHVLRRHLGTDRHIAENATATWNQAPVPAPSERKVGVLGLGALGGDAVEKLKALDFDVAGWSRSLKRIEGVPCYAGPEGLKEILARSEILVTILPDTPETRDIVNAETLAMARPGVEIVNPGRGSLIDDDALLAALDSGQVGHATLDVFKTEPLPAEHPYWRHEKVTVTPHVAAETQLEGAARLIVEQIGRLQRGEPLLHVVDLEVGY
jgi:glyoxylate/hydroxypyruvate reductase A